MLQKRGLVHVRPRLPRTAHHPYALLVVLLSLMCCASPEASRARGAGPGADIGNRGDTVEFHAGAEPYHDTPCVTLPQPCDGPLPVFGPI